MFGGYLLCVRVRDSPEDIRELRDTMKTIAENRITTGINHFDFFSWTRE